MQVRSSFSKKVNGLISNRLKNEVATINRLSACAGIRKKPKQARKARGNHYGEFYTEDGATYSVPVRQFIQAATHNMNRNFGPYAEEIKEILEKGIHEETRPQTTAEHWDAERMLVIRENVESAIPLFAGRKGPMRLMEKLAKQMEINQFNAIEEINIKGPKSNKPSTIKRKGKDHPLVDTGEMQMAIEGWVEQRR